MPVNRYYHRPRYPWNWSSHDYLNHGDKGSDKPRLEGDSGRDVATTDSDKDPDETDNWRRCALVTLGHRNSRRYRTSASVAMHRTNRAALRNLEPRKINRLIFALKKLIYSDKLYTICEQSLILILSFYYIFSITAF